MDETQMRPRGLRWGRDEEEEEEGEENRVLP